MGGKGYKPRKDYAGRTVSGDWEDSDRGAGNKATRRSGGKVDAKSPTYLAHVHNKGKKKVDPEKNPVVGEAKVDDVKYGKGKGWDQPEGKSATSYKARHSYLKKNPANVRSDRNKRHSEQDVVFHGHDKVERDRKAKHHASKGVKKVKGAKVDSGGVKALKKRFQDQGAMEAYQPKGEVVSEVAGTVVKQGGKALLKQQIKRKAVRAGIKVGGKTGGRAAQGGLSGAARGASGAIQKKEAGKGEKIGKVVGGLAGGLAGGAAGVPLGGVGAIATGVAGGEVGERVGGAIGKQFDKKKPTVKKENFSDWRNELTEAERSIADRLERKRKLYDKTTKKAMQDARDTGEASGHNRYRMSSINREYEALKAKRDKKDVKEAKVDAGKSPETKEKDRNVRRFGVSHNVAGHGKLRRSLHKMNRGDKKIPGDKSKWMEMESLQLGEEGYDRMRDARLVKYGIGHDGSDRKGSTSRPTGKQPKGKTVLQKETEKKYGKGVSALDVVKKQIEDKHGKGAIMDTKKK